jgi:DNA methylase
MKVSNLNTICPYYTMYPLQFPLGALRNAKPNKWVLDPFCGRGTTNYAARLRGMNTIGIDASPIAVAIASAKLTTTSATEVIREARDILSSKAAVSVPDGKFWERAFNRETLVDVCRLRKAIGASPSNSAQVVLRALILGVLHGPLTKGPPSYLSNQCPRTFSPKPAYAVRFWKRHRLRPPYVDVLQLIERRSMHCLQSLPQAVEGHIVLGDSRDSNNLESAPRFSWVITSPPYYGMRTYVPDQWLRNWFVGGPSHVMYPQLPSELVHSSPTHFSNQLGKVWRNAAKACSGNAKLIVRFGGINDRDVDPIDLVKSSLDNTPWRIVTIRSAGTAHNGKRQAFQFGAPGTWKPRKEYDVYARLGD